MGLFAWLTGREPDLDADDVSPELRHEAIDYLVKLVNPRLTLVPRYREKLEPGIVTTIRFLREQIPVLPVPREATRAAWSGDPTLRAMFATADDVPRLISRSQEVRDFFDGNPLAEEVYAVVGMALAREKVLGMAMQGEVIRREVPQTAVSFGDHKARILAAQPQGLRREIGLRLFEAFAMLALDRIGKARKRSKDLETDTALLRARQRTLQRQGAGVAGFSGGARSHKDADTLRRRLEENERELAALGGGAGQSERELETLREVLSQPGDVIALSTERMTLTTMNILVEGEISEPGSEIEYGLVRVNWTPPVERAFTIVRFPRSELRSGRLNYADAARFLASA